MKSIRNNFLMSAIAETGIPAPLSNRGAEYLEFSQKALEHVEGYTINQYSDIPDDLASTMTIKDCQNQIMKYSLRMGKGQRGEVEEKRDLLKISHYCAIIYAKMEAEND